ncbi:hypothetical protein VTI74DRAFT_3154 [Chaetomium olivicolor]
METQSPQYVSVSAASGHRGKRKSQRQSRCLARGAAFRNSQHNPQYKLTWFPGLARQKHAFRSNKQSEADPVCCIQALRQAPSPRSWVNPDPANSGTGPLRPGNPANGCLGTLAHVCPQLMNQESCPFFFSLAALSGPWSSSTGCPCWAALWTRRESDGGNSSCEAPRGPGTTVINLALLQIGTCFFAEELDSFAKRLKGGVDCDVASLDTLPRGLFIDRILVAVVVIVVVGVSVGIV